MEMTEERAREILNQDGDLILFENGGFEVPEVVYFNPEGGRLAKVDGVFYAEELEAIAFWMRNKGGEDG